MRHGLAPGGAVLKLDHVTYREDLASATERLARLDAVHAERAMAAERAKLEAERAAITTPRGSLAPVVFFGAVVAAFVGLRQVLLHHREAPPGSFELLVVALGVAFVVGVWSFWQNHLRLAALTRIDAQIVELVPRVRVAPESLAEAHERLGEREREESDLLRTL